MIIKETKLVSIVMPTFNSGHVIKETLDSVLSQSYVDWELIIIDDCSNDKTAEIIKDYALRCNKISFLVNDVNSGAGVSRNRGIQVARGRYLAFLDSDDLWQPNKLEVQIEFMRKHQSAISHTSFSFIDEVGVKRKGKVAVSNVVDLKKNLKNTEIGTSTAIIDRELVLQNIRFSEMRARQDLKLWIDLLGLGYISNGINEDLVKYRVRGGSVSSNKLKMLYVTLKVYMSIHSLTIYERLYCYSCYVTNAIKKRQK